MRSGVQVSEEISAYLREREKRSLIFQKKRNKQKPFIVPENN
jgi:hypothetical protein